ncbi:hypothetical protein ACIOWK_34425 [Pseudomonas protegens]|uniref:hypothetical protein n=1 Tax=Pseudomonas protegens TaxID=380021 RepID=UPI00381C3AD2
MKLTVNSVTVIDDFPDTGKTSIGGDVDLTFDMTDGQGGATISISFECEGARELTFNELERLLVERVKAELS